VAIPKKPMQENQDESSAQGWNKGLSFINGACQHCPDDNYKNSIECGLLGKRTFTAQSHHYLSRDEKNYAAHRNLQKM